MGSKDRTDYWRQLCESLKKKEWDKRKANWWRQQVWFRRLRMGSNDIANNHVKLWRWRIWSECRAWESLKMMCVVKTNSRFPEATMCTSENGMWDQKTRGNYMEVWRWKTEIRNIAYSWRQSCECLTKKDKVKNQSCML